MAINAPIGVIVLRPDPQNPTTGKIEFEAVQDPNNTPEKARIKTKRKRKVTWVIENYFEHPDKIKVTVDFGSDSPFDKTSYTEGVDDYSDDDGPGYDDIREKTRKDAAIKVYKYSISTNVAGITPIDPELEVEGDGNVDKK